MLDKTKILVIDDDPAIGLSIKAILEPAVMRFTPL